MQNNNNEYQQTFPDRVGREVTHLHPDYMYPTSAAPYPPMSSDRHSFEGTEHEHLAPQNVALLGQQQQYDYLQCTSHVTGDATPDLFDYERSIETSSQHSQWIALRGIQESQAHSRGSSHKVAAYHQSFLGSKSDVLFPAPLHNATEVISAIDPSLYNLVEPMPLSIGTAVKTLCHNELQLSSSQPPFGVQDPTGALFIEFQVGPDTPAKAHPLSYSLASSMLILDDWVLQGDLKSVSGSPALDVNSQQKASGSKQLKRTADASFDDAEIDNKRAKLSPLHSQAETDVQGPSQQPPKTGRYAKLGGVEDTELPDYSQTTLTFASREDAVQDFKTRLKSLEKHFRSSERDTSIPQTDSERQDAVCLVFGAMKDIAHARDVNSRDFNSRWAADAKRKYSDTDLEITSWEIVHLTKRLHREGPSALSIRDPNYLPHIEASAHLTFEQRLRVIATLAMEWKSRCNGLIKGDTMQTTVAAPLEALHSARSNTVANKRRADQLKFASEHENGPKKKARL